ncbi:MAG TPA: DUF4350 domain-containing protein [Acidimicrobiales bacterium]
MRRNLPWILLGAAVVLIGLLARREGSDEPFDPRSTDDTGTRALVLLLEEMGADVTIAPRPSSAGTAVLFVDELGKAQEERVLEWVRGGGVLVVTDPLSDFVPALASPDMAIFDESGADEEEGEALRNDCDLRSLEDVELVRVPAAARYRVPPDDVACFKQGRTAYLVARSEGSGTVVSLGGGAPFVNKYIVEDDNALFAVGLLAPERGIAVTVVVPDVAGSGDETLTDLLPDGTGRGMWQLAAAFVVLVLGASRRLGKPVPEPRPVEIPGSELVLAVGNMLQHAGRRDAAADMLRLQLRRELADRFGIPVDAPSDRVAAALAAHGVDAGRVTAVLAPHAVPDDKAFAAFAADVETLRREVVHV